VNWKIAKAKQRFSEVIRAVEEEPQWIYNRNKLVAGVVSAEALQGFLEWKLRGERPTMAEALSRLHRICQEESYSLEVPPRRNRLSSFANALDDSSR
jgi:prevent-host-death family protein